MCVANAVNFNWTNLGKNRSTNFLAAYTKSAKMALKLIVHAMTRMGEKSPITVRFIWGNFSSRRSEFFVQRSFQCYSFGSLGSDVDRRAGALSTSGIST